MGEPSSMAIARAGMISLAMMFRCQRSKIRGSDQLIGRQGDVDMRCAQKNRDIREE